MLQYKLYPLVNLYMDNEYSMMIYRQQYGYKKIIPVIFWLIQGNGRNILIDSGACDAEQATRTHYRADQTEDMLPENLVRSKVVDPSDIEAVILTHLHWDHCYNLEKFPNAKIYIQKRELVYALDPLPCHWTAYESSKSGLTPTWTACMDRFVVKDGDYSLGDGIDVYLMPGHSPGMQNICVNTSAGKYLIASDNVPLYLNWEKNEQGVRLASNIHYNLDEYYSSLDRMESVCDFVLPDHDILLPEHYSVFPPEDV